MGDITGHDAIAQCLAITDRCAEATGVGRYADGYRAAAQDIRSAIEARFGRRAVEDWEREVHEIEIEARTLSRVVALLRRGQTTSSSALVRRALADVIAAIEAGERDVWTREAG